MIKRVKHLLKTSPESDAEPAAAGAGASSTARFTPHTPPHPQCDNDPSQPTRFCPELGRLLQEANFGLNVGGATAQVSQAEQSRTLAAFKSSMQDWQRKLGKANVSLTLGNDSPPQRGRDEDLNTQEEIQKWERRLKQKEDDLLEERTKKATANAKRLEAVAELEKVKKELRKLESDCVKITAENNVLAARVRVLQGDNDDLVRDNILANVESKVACRRVKRVEEARDCSHIRHENEVSDIRDQLKETCRQLADSRVATAHAQGAKELTQVKLKAAEQMLETANERLSKHKSALAENARMLTAVRRELKMNEGIIAQLRNEKRCPKKNCTGITYRPSGIRPCQFQHNPNEIRARKITGKMCMQGDACTRGLVCRFVAAAIDGAAAAASGQAAAQTESSNSEDERAVVEHEVAQGVGDISNLIAQGRAASEAEDEVFDDQYEPLPSLP